MADHDLSLYEGSIGDLIGTLSDGVEYDLLVVLRSPAGAYYVAKGGSYTEYTMLAATTNDSTGTLYPSVQITDAALSIDEISVFDLPEPWISGTYPDTPPAELTGDWLSTLEAAITALDEEPTETPGGPTQTVTSTATATATVPPTPTNTPLPTSTPSYLKQVDLSSGRKAIIEFRVTVGEIAEVASVLLLVAVTLLGKMVDIPKGWFK